MPTKQISDEAWNAQKDEITSLYIKEDKTLDDVIKALEARGFKASTAQFKRQLGEWKISKNLTEKQWRAVIKRIKARDESLLLSEVLYHGRCLPSSKVRRAMQRYDRPRLCPSPSPGPEVMEGIRVCTPPLSYTPIDARLHHNPPRRLSPSPHLNRTEDFQASIPQLPYNSRELSLSQNALGSHHRSDQDLVHHLNGLPFIELQNCLGSLLKPLIQADLQLVRNSSLERMLPIAAHYLLGNRAQAGLMGLEPCEVTWVTISQSIENFRIPLRTPNIDFTADLYAWFVEFLLIGSTNSLFHPYKDQSLEGIVDSVSRVGAEEIVLNLICEYNLYAMMEKIVDLGTVTTNAFAAKALLSCIVLEDERLLKMLLAKGVPLDEVQRRWDPVLRENVVSAIHLAVEQQNETLICRLINAGIDPDGYVRIESFGPPYQLKPLSRLLSLFSVKPDSQVIQISTSVVEVMLDAQRRVYDLRRCESYLIALFVRAWLAEATDCLEFLQRRCRNLLAGTHAVHDRSLIHAIASKEDIDSVLQELLCSKHWIAEFHRSGLYHQIVSKILQKRSIRLLNLLLSESTPDFFMFDDPEILQWLGGQRNDLPHDFWVHALEVAFKSEDISYCKLIMKKYPDAYFELLLDENYGRISWYFWKALKDPETQEMANLMIRSLPSDVPDQAARNFLVGALDHDMLDLYQDLMRSLVLRGIKAEAFENAISRAIHGFCSETKLHFILNQIKQNFSRISWPNFDEENVELWYDQMVRTAFNGSLLLLQSLVQEGLPVNKHLFTACARGHHCEETMSWIICQFSSILHQLEPQDIRRCFAHSCINTKESNASFLDCPDYRVTQTLKLLCDKGLGEGSSWLNYLEKTNSKAIRILLSGWPCEHCCTTMQCTKPITAAVDTGDIDLMMQMIADGFSVDWSSCSASFPRVTPLGRAVCYNGRDVVDLLIQAGADVNVPSFGYFTGEFYTPLAHASSQGNFKIMYRLLDAGADANGRASIYAGKTALEAAAGAGHLDIVHLLVSRSHKTRSFKHECRRAARLARSGQQNFIAKFLEQQATAMTEEVGRDEIDDVIGDLCEHQLWRHSYRYIRGMCAECEARCPTAASWYASLVYYTDAIIPRWMNTGLEEVLTGKESLQELEDLIRDEVPKLCSYV